MKTITSQDLKTRIGKDIGLHVWNVTTDQYFKGEMIPGSRHIPVDKLEGALKGASVTKDSAIVVYCAGPACPASKMAAEQLGAAGYTNVTKYEGGVEEWKKAGYDINCEAGACTTGSCGTETDKGSCGTGTEKKVAGGCC
jgi:rhodanese-related sulfurtransferase